MIKIIFFDIDGTLLPLGGSKLSNKVLYALKKLKENNILVCFSSGRGNLTIPHFNDYEPDVIAAFNGAYCYNQKEIIYKEPLLKSDVLTILSNLKKHNRYVCLNNEKILVADGLDKDLKTYLLFGNEKPTFVSDFNEILKDDIYKIMFSCSIKERECFLANTKDVKLAAWWDKAVDLVNSNGGKGKGVKKILEYYHIDKDEAMAFGDGANDIEMFESVGVSVAMGNSKDDVKKKATYICSDVDNDGVYHFLYNNKIII